MKPLAVLLALAVLAPLSAHAQPAPIWGGHYNMGVFAAGSGSEADGHISLECSGDELADAGAFFLQLQPAASIEPFADARDRALEQCRLRFSRARGHRTLAFSMTLVRPVLR